MTRTDGFIFRARAHARALILPYLYGAGLLLLASAPAVAGTAGSPQALVTDYIDAWKGFYPSRAFAFGDAASAASFENFEDERVTRWLDMNARTARQVEHLLNDGGLDADTRVDLQVLRAQAVDEQATWREDRPLSQQPQWYAGRVSQALTHLLVRDQLTPPARRDALLARLRGVTALCHLGVERLEGGNALRTQRALRTLAGTRTFYQGDLVRLLQSWPDPVTAGAQNLATDSVIEQAIGEAIAAIGALEAHLEALLPSLPDDPAIGAGAYAAKLARRSGGQVTPSQLLDDALEEMHQVRTLMVAQARRWWRSQGGDAESSTPGSDDTLLARALEAMETDRQDTQSEFLAQFEGLTRAAEQFVVEHRIATVPGPTTLFIALSPPHFSGAAVGGVYPSGPFDPSADTLFYVPSVPDEAPPERREGFYRSFNDHFNTMIISHEMFPGHYLQYKVAVSEAPPVRSLFSNGAYTEGWGSFVEELMLDQGWAGNAPLTRLAHLRKRLENATRAAVSVRVHTAGWDREQVLAFARDEGLLAPQFAENLWHRAVHSPLQITDYHVGWVQFQALYAARGDGPLRDWVDAVLRAGPVPPSMLEPMLTY